MITLDVDAVEAFVAIADQQSFTRAAETLSTTQAAVSIKLRRLEDRVGHRLVERTPRLVRLSAQGELFLESARDFLAAHRRAVAGLSQVRRRFTLGIATQIGGPEIPALLTRLNAYDPQLVLEVRSESAHDLLGALDRGEVDAAIMRREEDRRTGEVLVQERFGWFATPDFEFRAGEPLRLAASSPSCGMRDSATRALDAAGISWREVFFGCGSFAISDAVATGLATGIFSFRLAPSCTVDIGERFGLPSLPSSEIAMLSSLSDERSRRILRIIAATFREHGCGTYGKV
ncbi:LysR family transcriptional regulator [Bradyrhizobium sp. USDA 3256]